IATLSGCSKAPPEPPPTPPPLSKQGLSLSSWKAASPDLHDRLLLAHALAKGDTEGFVLVATDVGRTPSVAAAIASLGGNIQTRFDDVGYLRVRLALDRLADVSALPDVLMAHLDGGGAHGLYANDSDRVRYALPAETSSRPRVELDVAGLSLNATDTLLGADVGSPTTMLAAEIESLLQAAASAEINVLARDQEGGRFPGGGSDLFALMANRAVEVYGKPLLFAASARSEAAGSPSGAAGGFGQLESVAGASSGRRVISVGEYTSSADARSRSVIAGAAGTSSRAASLGVAAEGASSKAASLGASADGEIPLAAARGPAADGAAKPDLLMQGGVEAAGAATDALIAAARAENLPADARHITWALRMSASRLDRYQAHEQGFGVIDTEKALGLLKQLKAKQLDLPDIQNRAPVKTYFSRFLPEPNLGQGLYEREGWLVGQKDTRTITLLRQSGAATPLAYTLEWRGNDGTFKSTSQEITLTLNEPVTVPVEIAATDAGVHSAHLYLTDQASGLPVHAVMTTIIAAEPFKASNGYRVEHREQTVQAAEAKRYFLDIPPNISSLRIDASVGVGRAQLSLNGGALDLPPSKAVTAGQPAVLLVPYPPPGVYELTATSANAPVTNLQVTASTRYVDSQLDEKPPTNNATTLWMNNIYAPIQRSAILTTVGARRMLKDTGGLNGLRAYNITVEPGSTSLRVAVAPPDGRTRVGLYLYDCASGTCKLWDSDVLTRPVNKALVVPNPRSGLWRVVVDATAPGVAFEYTEIVTHPRFGSGTVEGNDVERRTGARWNQKVSYQVTLAPPFGHDLVGLMDVVDPASEGDERAAPFSDWQASGDGRNQPLRPLRLSTQVIALTH
ncbi:hypothetical protein, partial [Steroidobacter sp.]|uniref:hypothetical protein n=1 Tax=Steroidobacter sp. TaxID=1978227 RepID=UPI001A45285F